MVKAIMEEMKRIAEKCIEDNNAPPGNDTNIIIGGVRFHKFLELVNLKSVL